MKGWTLGLLLVVQVCQLHCTAKTTTPNGYFGFGICGREQGRQVDYFTLRKRRQMATFGGFVNLAIKPGSISFFLSDDQAHRV